MVSRDIELNLLTQRVEFKVYLVIHTILYNFVRVSAYKFIRVSTRSCARINSYPVRKKVHPNRRRNKKENIISIYFRLKKKYKINGRRRASELSRGIDARLVLEGSISLHVIR